MNMQHFVNVYSTCESILHKVHAHTGDTYNEMADQLAKAGAAIGK